MEGVMNPGRQLCVGGGGGEREEGERKKNKVKERMSF